MLPDCYFVDQRIPVSLHNIEYRIQFQYICQKASKTKIIKVPHDWGNPYTNLKHNIDDLTQISEEYNRRTCHICDCQNQHKNAEAVVYQLQCIQTRRISHAGINHQYDHNKKTMYKYR